MGRSRQRSSKQRPVGVHSFTLFPLNFSTLSSPNFLLFIAKVSGKIMITATVCAFEGPILFDLGGCLGERAVLHL